jgi:hypothetical protein
MSPETEAFITGGRARVVVQRQLGPPGRLVSRSKSGYRAQFPDHLVIFNAQVSVGGLTVWRGDLDLSLDERRRRTTRERERRSTPSGTKRARLSDSPAVGIEGRRAADLA